MFLLMYLSVFPSIKAQAQSLNKLLETYPKTFMKAFSVDTASFETLPGYLAVESYGVVWQLLIILLGTSFAGSALAGEVEQGTLAVTLGLPISRTKVFISRYLAGATALAIFMGASIVVLLGVATFGNNPLSYGALGKMALTGWLWAMAIYSLAFMVSAIFSEKSKVYMLTGGLLLGMYALKIFSGLLPRLDKLKYASIFQYQNSADALVRSHINGVSLGVCIGAWIFQRRDISI